MIDAGYRETKVGNGIWKPASEIKAEPKVETTQTSQSTTTKLNLQKVMMIYLI